MFLSVNNPDTLVCLLPSRSLLYLLLHHVSHLILKVLSLLLRSEGIGSGTKSISGDLTGTFIGEEHKPQRHAQKNLQHDTASCSEMILRIVERASPVCSLIDR